MAGNIRIDIHVCTYNEELMLPHFMNYYTKYASHIYVHDNGSTDSTVEIANKFGAIVDVMTTNAFDDYQNIKYKHDGYYSSYNSDYVFMLDCDEFIVHNDLIGKLKWCQDNNILVPTMLGYDMVYDNFDYRNNNISDVTHGVQLAYGKPCVVKSNQEIEYDIGCHHINKPIQEPYDDPDPLKFLHMKYLNLDVLVNRHVNLRSRFPVSYVKSGIGWHYFGDGFVIKQYMEIKEKAIKVL